MAVLQPQVGCVLRNQGRLVADVTRIAPGFLDVAVGEAEPEIAVESIEDASLHFDLRACEVDAIEISQILRARIWIEHEEVGPFRLRVVDAEVGADAPVEKFGLGAPFDGIRRLGVEQVADTGDTCGTDARLIEAAAAEAAAVTDIQR